MSKSININDPAMDELMINMKAREEAKQQPPWAELEAQERANLKTDQGTYCNSLRGTEKDTVPPATRLLASVQCELHQRRDDATRNVQRMQRLEALRDLLAANPEVARILELKAELGL